MVVEFAGKEAWDSGESGEVSLGEQWGAGGGVIPVDVGGGVSDLGCEGRVSNHGLKEHFFGYLGGFEESSVFGMGLYVVEDIPDAWG